MRIILQPAFVLHHRPYRETSVLLDLFTLEFGRITAVARGVRQTKSRLRPLLQLFVPLLVSWQGSGELVTLIGAESNGYPNRLLGTGLLNGLYLNELLMRVLQKQDPHSALYTIYQQTLLELQGPQLQQKTLRLFEKKLLQELGFGLQLTEVGLSYEGLIPEKYYQFHSEQGFELSERKEAINVFPGKSLLAFAADQLDDPDVLRDAKRLMRLALAPMLGKQRLNSRQLYSFRLTNQVEEDKTE